MKKSELIKALQEIEEDFEVEGKHPGQYSSEITDVNVNESTEIITIYLD